MAVHAFMSARLTWSVTCLNVCRVFLDKKGNSLPDWYHDSDPLRVAYRVYVRLIPVFALVSVIWTLLVVVDTILFDVWFEFGNTTSEMVHRVYSFTVVLLFAIAITLVAGVFSVFAVAIFDKSIGNVISLASFGAASVGMSVVPLAIILVFLHGYAKNGTGLDWISLTYFVVTIAIGSFSGFLKFLRSVTAKPEWHTRFSFQFSVRQMLVVTVWIAIVLLVGLGVPIIGMIIAIYAGTVFAIVALFSLCVASFTRSTTADNKTLDRSGNSF